MSLPSSLPELQAAVSGALSDLLGTTYRKIGRTVVATGPALFAQWAGESVTDATVSGLGVFIDRTPRYGVTDLHSEAALSSEWQVYLVQHRGSDHLDAATQRLLRALPQSRATPLGDLDEDGNVLAQTVVTVQGATT